jgi:hypothetical protein
MSNPEVETPAQEVVEDTQLSHVFDPAALARSIEAILMIVDEPVTELTLASVLQVTVDQVVDALEALVPTYEDRGFTLKAINGGSIAILIAARLSRSLSSMVSRTDLLRRPLRPWLSSHTANLFLVPESRLFVASTLKRL